MSIINFLKKTAFVINYRFKNNAKNWKLYKQQLKNQYLPRKELEKIQLENLKNIIAHAYAHVPFYHNLYKKHKIKPESIKTLSDIKKLPTILKDDIKNNSISYLTADSISKELWFKRSSSGTMGNPIGVYGDTKVLDNEHAAWLRELDCMGYKIGDKILKIRINSTEDRGKVSRFIDRQRYISIFEAEKNFVETIKAIKEFKPDIIETWPNGAVDMAKYLIKNKDSIKVKGIQIIGGPISDKEREIIKKAFVNSKICADFTSAEALRVCYQCEQEKGYHIDVIRYLVEVLKDGKNVGENKEGELVITNLENYVMPLIRYRIGDSAIRTSKICSCGRTLPLLKDIGGRLYYNFTTPEGKLIRTKYFHHVFQTYYGYIDRFQLVRTGPKNMLVKIKPSPQMTEKALEKIEKELSDYFGDDLIFEIKFVKKIPLAATGKAILLKHTGSIYSRK